MYLELFISIFIFSIYVQLSPSMGNVWIRKNSNNNNILCLNNLVILIFKPFTEWYFWSYKFLLINFWIYLIIILIIVNSIKLYDIDKNHK